jgi:DNA-binding NtrC family response regulator
VKNPANPLVFIIDSNAAYRKILNSCLNALNFTNLRTFECCEECLDSEEKPDIVILDNNLKDYHLSGLDFLIGHKQEFPDTHFLFFSSDPDVDVAVRSIKWGASDYFIKGKKGLEKLVVRFNNLIQSYNVMRRKKVEYNLALFSLGMFGFIFAAAIFFYSLS